MAEDPHAIKSLLLREARAQGFDCVGVTAPDTIAVPGARLRQFIASGSHGDMNWLADRLEWRADPQALWPEVRSVIMLGVNYGPDHDPRAITGVPGCGAISVHAQGNDYHAVVKKRLKALAGFVVRSAPCVVKVFVDTAPVMEKPLAAAAALGWQGKHTNLVSSQFGSWLFLGAIYTTLVLPRDQLAPDRCGSCRACLDSCPTAAFSAPRKLDARRCISYLTIENKGPIPSQFRKAIGNRIYGCDACLAACPWNKFARKGREPSLGAREALRAPELAGLALLDEASFRALFAKSPVKRIGWLRFLRNVAIALGNCGDPAMTGVVGHLIANESPLVRGAAVWALSRISQAAEFDEARAAALLTECDESVVAEWLKGAGTDY